ncbi:MAG: aminoacyl-tRNA hydrolase [Bifidobacteriaceae bacterium]|nr:aminoacyl-tRNA hydrolase [Bifidobacteriaceae bacterium]
MTSKYWLIVGLGNPGKQYEGTRHNMGFLCLDELASRWSVSFHDHKGLTLLGSGVMRLDSRMEKAFFIKPLTFMNNSGEAVASICEYYGIDPAHVIVCHDDMDLEFGRIKVKAGGSTGGHNGIRSIDASLGTNKYTRVRIGTGHPQRGEHAHQNTIDWVLGEFPLAQRKELPTVLTGAAGATESIVFRGLEATQGKYNAR